MAEEDEGKPCDAGETGVDSVQRGVGGGAGAMVDEAEWRGRDGMLHGDFFLLCFWGVVPVWFRCGADVPEPQNTNIGLRGQWPARAPLSPLEILVSKIKMYFTIEDNGI